MNTPELDELITRKTNQERPVSSATLNKYIQQYWHLSTTLKQKDNWILGASIDKLVRMINSLNTKATGKLNYLNIMIMIKEADKDVNKLVELRTRLMSKKDEQVKDAIHHKKATLPSYDVIVKYIDSLYKQKNYKDYLINYLIFTYGLRNKDINLTLVKNDDFKKYTFVNSNYLIIKKTECMLYITDYKTASSYGVKKIVVRSRRVLNAVQYIGVGSLITNKFNQSVNDTNLNYYINLYDKLNESDYYKININHLQSQPNSLQKIAKLCNTRGSCDVNVLNRHYNINV